MKVRCVSCGYELNLDHKIFDDYSGSVRCYSCSAMMEVKTAQGLICSMSSQSNSGRRIAGLLAAGPTVDTDFSSGMAGWERSSGNDIRTKT